MSKQSTSNIARRVKQNLQPRYRFIPIYQDSNNECTCRNKICEVAKEMRAERVNKITSNLPTQLTREKPSKEYATKLDWIQGTPYATVQILGEICEGLIDT